MEKQETQKWTTVIRADDRALEFRLGELLRSRELIWMFCKRYFSTMYRQTVLGPLWLIISPFLTSVVYTVIFGNLAKLSTDGLPQLLFYMSGTTIWNLLSSTLTACSQTFASNSNVYSKVYFPRLAVPASSVICGIINFLIQFVMLLLFWVYYFVTGQGVNPNIYLLYMPVLIVQTALLGMGMGLIATALTTKYKDLAVLINFGLQLWMYATPIVYPLSETSVFLRRVIVFNPMTPIVEAFRYMLLGAGSFHWGYLMISMAATIAVLLVGIVLFNRVEKSFVDTI